MRLLGSGVFLDVFCAGCLIDGGSAGLSRVGKRGSKETMQVTALNPVRWKLNELAVEACKALARLDADRLEELALCCQALERSLTPMKPAEREALRQQARAAAHTMAVFARVLEATRANLQVMYGLGRLHAERLEYGGWERAEMRYGHD
jgi:hypothetical protein